METEKKRLPLIIKICLPGLCFFSFVLMWPIAANALVDNEKTTHFPAAAIARKIIPWAANEEPPAPKGDVVIVIDTVQRKLTVYANGEQHKQYPCAVGTNDTPTPVGNWEIQRKAMNWGTGFGTRWLGLNVPWGIFGVHGTNKPGSIGSFASHGCIRMFNRHVEEIYPWVAVGTPVIIVGNPFGNPGCTHRTLRNGEKGSDVMEVQRNLKRLGYYEGETDGIFGGGTEKAVIEFRKKHNLRYDNCIDEDCYKLLGL